MNSTSCTSGEMEIHTCQSCGVAEQRSPLSEISVTFLAQVSFSPRTFKIGSSRPAESILWTILHRYAPSAFSEKVIPHEITARLKSTFPQKCPRSS